ncbi:hypothetical protein ABZT04_24760 [Streptomyces sp. NPDC005492]|uniref:hypothetical protein n=1 Tax=Streptomyces sp. NPDC005492 TaxID=3156883 RepID=UPI0033BC8F1F
MVVLLLGVLALLIGGCACVVWAERGGPRWARVVATITLTMSELLRSSDKKRRRGLNRSDGGDD